ncbi:deoxyribose-phosphate aldolase [Dellaglioa sp. L3N]
MEVAEYIDHTLLKADANQDGVMQVISEAKDNHFATVMVNPYWVSYAARLLKTSDVRIATVIGFPLGANKTKVKVFEAECAIKDGAQEIDMVQNIGELKAKNYDIVIADIKAVVEKAHANKVLVKVIIETALLSDEEIVIASRLVAQAGADFVKTSTGFSTRGASIHDIKMMNETIGNQIKIKASGGIHTLEEAKVMIMAGASRIGTSSGVTINGQ